ncbi:MAG TPA: class I SAM-dependent methyltransferase [Phycisphaerae bacterium]|nr:class I SAM-dependent methyltransferase [Phycisphaerae bacterium]HRR85240.1 class I SAM-dependent methyltransferase [Phycisphaerae bacterium]
MQNGREAIIEYFNRVAPEYGVKHGADMPGGQYSFGQLYRRILSPYFKPGMEVLELGCGNGASTEMLASYGVKLVATDICEKMLKVAAARGIANTTFRCLDIMEIAGAQDLGGFDVIVSFNAFSYLPDKARVLHDLSRLLRPQGRLIILDMNALSPVYWFCVLMGRNEMRQWWGAIKEMTPGNLRFLFQRCGYAVELIRTLNFVPHATQGRVFRALRAMNPLLNATPLIRKLAMRVLVVATRSEAHNGSKQGKVDEGMAR